MTDEQWKMLLRVIDGEAVAPLPVGFIIDSPWLPPWVGSTVLDYYASEGLWLEANLRAVRRFPGVMFLPGFWSEYGMCTEPSAFGSKCVWQETELPFADKTLDYERPFGKVPRPDPRTDGLLPLMLRRLVRSRGEIERAGHAIKFAVCRGPLNVASFLLGTTELMIGIKEKPEECHALLTTITDFLVDWLRVQKEALPTIEGIFALDDLVGFLGEEDFVAFARPYLKRMFAAFEAPVRFFHNDAQGLVSARHLREIGVNLFNFSFEHSLEQIRGLAGETVTLLGNIPPRDVMAGGSAADVRRSVAEALAPVKDRRRLILSVGGGMAPGTPTENIEAFIATAQG